MITKQEILKSQVKALSWKQPFGSLMLHGKVETRTWMSHYHGLVLICTSKTSYPIDKLLEICGRTQFNRILEINETTRFRIHEGGMAIAVGRFTKSKLMTPNDEDACFVKYEFGKYCHIYTEVTPIKPFPWKGSQGFRNVTQEQKQLIEIL